MMFIVALIACMPTHEARTRSALIDAGFSDIETTGYAWVGCGEEDYYHTGFVATNPKGKRVDGIVCCGLHKFCTIRY